MFILAFTEIRMNMHLLGSINSTKAQIKIGFSSGSPNHLIMTNANRLLTIESTRLA